MAVNRPSAESPDPNRPKGDPEVPDEEDVPSSAGPLLHTSSSTESTLGDSSQNCILTSVRRTSLVQYGLCVAPALGHQDRSLFTILDRRRFLERSEARYGQCASRAAEQIMPLRARGEALHRNLVSEQTGYLFAAGNPRRKVRWQAGQGSPAPEPHSASPRLNARARPRRSWLCYRRQRKDSCSLA